MIHTPRQSPTRRPPARLRAYLTAYLCGAAIVVLTVTQAWAVEDRLSSIQERGTLRVCIWPHYYAITYRNPRTGGLEGLDIDMARSFAEDLGVRVTFVDSCFSNLITAMTTDACDVAMHGVGVREDRTPYMDFSAPYLVSSIFAVTSRTHPTITKWEDIDQPGHVVVVQKGTLMEPEMRARLQHAELSVVDAFKEREQEVLSGRADVFMTDYPYGRRMIDLTDWARLISPPQPLAATPYAFAVPKDEPKWLARVNAFVRQVKADGRLRAAADRNGLLPILAP